MHAPPTPGAIRRATMPAVFFITSLAGSALPQAPRTSAPLISAPIGNVRYEVTFDSAAAQSGMLKIAMTFDVTGAAPVLLSLPAWTPGAYEISNFAHWVSNFDAQGNGKALTWDKTDYDTWRLQPAGARTVTVSFDYLADTLDNAMAWSRPDFALFNGTNVFLYPEGRSLDFPATVRIKTASGWLVATGMHPVPGNAGLLGERNYHDLVDMPFFIGHFDYDSMMVAGHWARLATYPAGTLASTARDSVWQDIRRMIPTEAAVFQDTPWDNYTTMMIFSPTAPGGSALEHQSSHVGVYTNQLIGSPILASITAHEMFHSWNVKRLRPADMWPYRYDQPLPTPWLWVSEGITDYYADLTMVRGGIVDSSAFLETTSGKIRNVDGSPPVALEDASLSTWVHPTDGTGYLYYPKGSLAGLMLDIMIRDASDNHKSLDLVMRENYTVAYKRGRGFTAADWWGAVSRDAGGRSFTEFNAKYVDGREPYPWNRVLPLAGLRMVSDTLRLARVGLGTTTAPDSSGSLVTQVVPGGAGAAAGVQTGDLLLSVGDVKVSTQDFGPEFRKQYASRDGEDLPIVVRRGGQEMTLTGKVRVVPEVATRVDFDPAASPKALRIRSGILKGTVDQ
ncbi:MAG: PDZ domain-containing protein [Gemmatimonadota bacterium]